MTRLAWWLWKASPKGFGVDLNFDRSTGIECPRPNCNKIVVYNGNYFCECGWALPDVDPKRHPGMQEYVKKLYASMGVR